MQFRSKDIGNDSVITGCMRTRIRSIAALLEERGFPIYLNLSPLRLTGFPDTRERAERSVCTRTETAPVVPADTTLATLPFAAVVVAGSANAFKVNEGEEAPLGLLLHEPRPEWQTEVRTDRWRILVFH